MKKFVHAISEKIHKYSLLWNVVCDVLELAIASLVTIALIISIVSLVPELVELFQSGQAYANFTEYLEKLFSCVVGIEFLKMLCHPNSDNIMETLIFLVARHMIISSTTTPVDNLISVFTIILLVLIRRLLATDRKKSLAKGAEAKDEMGKGSSGKDFTLKGFVKEMINRNDAEE